MYLSTRLWNLKKKESFGFTENGKKNQRNVWRKRIRKENKYAKVICVILKDNNFKRYSHQKKVKNPINTYDEIYKYSKEILEEFYHNEPVRLIGIRLDDLQNNKIYQTSLFEKNPENNEKIDKIMDQINTKYGKDVVKRASFLENNSK